MINPVKEEPQTPGIINNEGGTGAASFNELDNIDFQYNANIAGQQEGANQFLVPKEGSFVGSYVSTDVQR